jgi:hypothetical protein
MMLLGMLLAEITTNSVMLDQLNGQDIKRQFHP